MGWLWPALAVLALWAGITLWRRSREGSAPGVRTTVPYPRTAGRDDEDDAIDWQTLEAAEREVKDLAPGEEPSEWGPGTPKPPIVG
jgi:hypothetical protein